MTITYEQARAEFEQARKDGRPARFAEGELLHLESGHLPTLGVSGLTSLCKRYPQVEVECADREPLGGGLEGYLEALDDQPFEPRQTLPTPSPQTCVTLQGYRWVSADRSQSFQVFATSRESAEAYIRHLEVSQAPLPSSSVALTADGVVQVPVEYADNSTYTVMRRSARDCRAGAARLERTIDDTR